jgi:hypothetical protein
MAWLIQLVDWLLSRLKAKLSVKPLKQSSKVSHASRMLEEDFGEFLERIFDNLQSYLCKACSRVIRLENLLKNISPNQYFNTRCREHDRHLRRLFLVLFALMLQVASAILHTRLCVVYVCVLCMEVSRRHVIGRYYICYK